MPENQVIYFAWPNIVWLCILGFHQRRSHEILFRRVVAILYFVAKDEAAAFILPIDTCCLQRLEPRALGYFI